MAALFPDGEDQLPRLNSKQQQSWVLNELGGSYHMLGRSRQAAALAEEATCIDEKESFKAGLAVKISNLGQEQVNLGELAAAERNHRRCVELSQEAHKNWECVGHQELGLTLAIQARFDEADEELKQALENFKDQGDLQGAGVIWAYRALRRLLLGEPREAFEAAEQALAFWEKSAKETYPNARDRVRVEWLVGWAHTALAARAKRNRTSHFTKAETCLSEALTHCRRIQLVESEGDILLALARWHRLKDDAAQAAKLAHEALDIADRCEYRLQQADIRNFLAQLALEREEPTAAREHAEIARERALCDEPEHNPVHCYKPALDEADRLLKLCNGKAQRA